MASKKKSVSKKTTSKKAPAKKAIKKAVKKAIKKTVKNAVMPVKKVTKKVAKPAVKTAAAAGRIDAITPSKDSAVWTLALQGGAKVQVPSAAAQSAEIRVGGAWNAKAEAKVAAATQSQALLTKAMGELAKNGKTSKSVMVKKLGGDANATATVATLVRNGWIA